MLKSKKKATAPAFQFYPNDWLGSLSVQQLSLHEEGAYIRALCYCWNNGSLPANPERLSYIIGKNCSIETASKIASLFIKKNDELFHKRLIKEVKKQQENSKKRSKAGTAGASKRWQKDGICHPDAIAKNSLSSSSSISTSVNNIVPTKKRFLKPTKELLSDYFVEIGLDDFTAQAQASLFHDHFESNGWKVGGKAPMKNWQAAARNWKKNMSAFSKNLFTNPVKETFSTGPKLQDITNR